MEYKLNDENQSDSMDHNDQTEIGEWNTLKQLNV